MLVSAILQAKGGSVVGIRPDASVLEAARLLHDRRIGVLVVQDEAGGILGIISERDIVRGLVLHGGQVENLAVADLMTEEVQVCEPADSLDRLMAVMTNRRIRHLPVVDKGVLSGIVSIGDVVKTQLDEATMEVDSLRNYVMGGR